MQILIALLALWVNNGTPTSRSAISHFQRADLEVGVPLTAKKVTCPKARSNLVVVNFTTSPLRVFVNGKKIGSAPAFDQKIFKEVLPLGNPLVHVTSAKSGPAALAEASFEIKNEGKKTCKRTLPLVVR